MKIINYADFHTADPAGKILDLKLFDIPFTMERNVKKCAELGASAVTVADNPLNCDGIVAAQAAGKKYGIAIIIGNP